MEIVPASRQSLTSSKDLAVCNGESDLLRKRLDELVFPELLRAFSLVVFEEFKELVTSVADLSNAKVSVANVKGVDRMRVKRQNYEDDHCLDKPPFTAYITDTLRCTFICPQTDASDSMSRAWDQLNDEPRLTVLRLKNKALEEVNPYNLHVNVMFEPKCCQCKIIVEIQIQNERVYNMKKINHGMYQIVRAPNAEEL
uniref:Uncharacterized protein n=1 Tax=Octactis speculum TaxID=3111310 RepID=A0A7S2GUF6_9STRA